MLPPPIPVQCTLTLCSQTRQSRKPNPLQGWGAVCTPSVQTVSAPHPHSHSPAVYTHTVLATTDAQLLGDISSSSSSSSETDASQHVITISSASPPSRRAASRGGSGGAAAKRALAADSAPLQASRLRPRAVKMRVAAVSSSSSSSASPRSRESSVSPPTRRAASAAGGGGAGECYFSVILHKCTLTLKQPASARL